MEVLIFDKNEIAFFPEDVQREIVSGLRKTQNIERPYTDKEMEYVTSQFVKWDAKKQDVLLEGLRQQIPSKMQLEPSSFVNKDKPMLVNLTKEFLVWFFTFN